MKPEHNANNMNNANKGTRGQNQQRAQNQGNRGWQMNPQRQGAVAKSVPKK
jgi:hypothetical protein